LLQSSFVYVKITSVVRSSTGSTLSTIRTMSSFLSISSSEKSDENSFIGTDDRRETWRHCVDCVGRYAGEVQLSNHRCDGLRKSGCAAYRLVGAEIAFRLEAMHRPRNDRFRPEAAHWRECTSREHWRGNNSREFG
jgi:hypothetical protein